VGVAPTATWLM